MKIVQGSVEALPPTTHVEQDGDWFFVMATKTVYGTNGDFEIPPTLAVIDSGMEVGFDLASGKAAQDAVRAFLATKNTTPTFDY
jgi:L-aminopeptidase/D-esterase-like protein